MEIHSLETYLKFKYDTTARKVMEILLLNRLIDARMGYSKLLYNALGVGALSYIYQVSRVINLGHAVIL